MRQEMRDHPRSISIETRPFGRPLFDREMEKSAALVHIAVYGRKRGAFCSVLFPFFPKAASTESTFPLLKRTPFATRCRHEFCVRFVSPADHLRIRNQFALRCRWEDLWRPASGEKEWLRRSALSKEEKTNGVPTERLSAAPGEKRRSRFCGVFLALERLLTRRSATGRGKVFCGVFSCKQSPLLCAGVPGPGRTPPVPLATARHRKKATPSRSEPGRCRNLFQIPLEQVVVARSEIFLPAFPVT